jgi:hypothetical protein
MIDHGTEQLFEGEAVKLPWISTEAGALLGGSTTQERLAIVRVVATAWWLPLLLLVPSDRLTTWAIEKGISLEIVAVYKPGCEAFR